MPPQDALPSASACGSAFKFIKLWSTCKWPAEQADITGVKPSADRALSWSPDVPTLKNSVLYSKTQISAWPASAATCNGPFPLTGRTLGLWTPPVGVAGGSQWQRKESK